MMALRQVPIALLALLLLAACDLNVKQPAYSGIYVYGVVSDEAGSHVAGVQVRIGYRPMDACSTSGFSAPAITPATDTSGAYGAGIVDSGAAHDVCVKLVTMAPSTGALADDSALVRNVTLTESLADSLRVDFTLPPKLR